MFIAEEWQIWGNQTIPGKIKSKKGGSQILKFGKKIAVATEVQGHKGWRAKRWAYLKSGEV